jgi:uncharacterized surface protein with fasciclin (FAS1) repeats
LRVFEPTSMRFATPLSGAGLQEIDFGKVNRAKTGDVLKQATRSIRLPPASGPEHPSYLQFAMEDMMISNISKAAIVAAMLGLGGCMTAAPMQADGSNAISYVGGAAMYPAKNIVENAVNSPEHTTLVAAVKAAGLAGTLAGAGPFTVFAPTNAAFANLPAGTVETLLMPENKATLTSVLTYHVLPRRMTADDLLRAIQAGGGQASLVTVQGSTLTARMEGSGIVLTDAKGGRSAVTQANVMQSNGVIHVTDAVSMPG